MLHFEHSVSFFLLSISLRRAWRCSYVRLDLESPNPPFELFLVYLPFPALFDEIETYADALSAKTTVAWFFIRVSYWYKCRVRVSNVFDASGVKSQANNKLS
jgi:hypothetical protein